MSPGLARKPSGVERFVLVVGDTLGTINVGPAPGVVTRAYEKDRQHGNEQYVDVATFGPVGGAARHLVRIRYVDSEAEALRLTGDPQHEEGFVDDRNLEAKVAPLAAVAFPDTGVQPFGRLPDTLA